MAGETLSCLKVHTISLPSEDKQPRKENEELSLQLATTELCREFTDGNSQGREVRMAWDGGEGCLEEAGTWGLSRKCEETWGRMVHDRRGGGEAGRDVDSMPGSQLSLVSLLR